MKGFKFQPVAWMAIILATLDAVIGANELFHVLPESWTPVLLFVSAILTALLGRSVWERVTPLARPRDDDGNQLVPVDEAPAPLPRRDTRDTPMGYLPDDGREAWRY